jgi:hypothetical protein
LALLTTDFHEDELEEVEEQREEEEEGMARGEEGRAGDEVDGCVVMSVKGRRVSSLSSDIGTYASCGPKRVTQLYLSTVGDTYRC